MMQLHVRRVSCDGIFYFQGLHSVGKTAVTTKKTKNKEHDHKFKNDGTGSPNAVHAVYCQNGWINGNSFKGS